MSLFNNTLDLKGYIPSVNANGALVDDGEEVKTQNMNLSLSVP